MTLAEVCRKNNILSTHLAKAMGCSRQNIEQIGKYRSPHLHTLEKACKGFERLGIHYTPAELFAELMSDLEEA